MLIQIVLALALLHLLLDAAADTLLDLQQIDLGFHVAHQVLKALADINDLKDRLLLFDLERHVCGNRIRKTRRVIDTRKRRQDLRRDLLVQLDVLIELVQNRTRQHLRLALRQCYGSHERDLCFEILLGPEEVQNAGALGSLDKHLYRAVRELQELQNAGDRPDAVNVVRLRIVLSGALLRHEHDLLIGLHGRLERLDGFIPPHEQGNDHVRIDHHITQRQDRNHHQLVVNHFGSLGFLLHNGVPRNTNLGKMARLQRYLACICR